MSDSLKEIQEKLNSISPTMCLVKWKHATLNLGASTVKTCCHNPSRKIEYGQVEMALHDTKADRNVRKELLAGQKPAACQYCWAMEKGGNYSDRTYWSNQEWMKESFEEVANHKSDKALVPSWLELNFSSNCQLKCSYCNPGYSTSWQKEIQEFGSYPTTSPHNDLSWFKAEGLLNEKKSVAEEDSIQKNFWSWFESALPHVRLLTLTGGEPLLAKENFKILDYIIANPQPHLELAINSNLCLPDSIWNNFVEKIAQMKEKKSVKQVYLHPSLDSWGKRAEYIRFGLDLDLFQKNLRTFLEKTTANVVINCTLNNLSLGGLLDYWKFVVRVKKEFGHNRWISSTSENIVFPSWQRLNILPPDFDKYLEDVETYMKSETGYISEHEIDGIRRARTVLANKAEVKEDDYYNFYRFFINHDIRRKTDFNDTFPELVEFFKECSTKKLSVKQKVRTMAGRFVSLYNETRRENS